jgi:hypothetical protein
MDDALHTGAKIFAQWLAVEIAVANEQEIALGLNEGNLQARLGVPVLDAFTRYREVIPESLVNETTYFKDALNEIVAGGEKVF